jgi:hypothetical protein
MEYIGSIKFCIFTFSLLFKELDGVYGYIRIAEKIKDIFIHIYKDLYIGLFRPISHSQKNIDKLHKIICSKGAANAVTCENLSLLYAEKTISYLTTPHSDDHWFMQTIEEYYYIGGINIVEWRLIEFDKNNKLIMYWLPIHNILLSHLDNKLYRFHIDEMTRHYIDEDITILDAWYSNELCNLLNIVNNEDGDMQFNYIANTYEYDNKVMFWVILCLVFSLCTDYKDIPKKRDLLMKQCTVILYTRYFNNTMLLTYIIELSDILSICDFIKMQFGSIFEFLAYFNNSYPDAAVDLEVDRPCCLLNVV